MLLLFEPVYVPGTTKSTFASRSKLVIPGVYVQSGEAAIFDSFYAKTASVPGSRFFVWRRVCTYEIYANAEVDFERAADRAQGYDEIPDVVRRSGHGYCSLSFQTGERDSGNERSFDFIAASLRMTGAGMTVSGRDDGASTEFG